MAAGAVAAAIAIRAGRIDIVVVYKVDRLTRSLADFARVVGIFDAQGVRFVSVTQQYTRKALPEPLHRWSGLTAASMASHRAEAIRFTVSTRANAVHHGRDFSPARSQIAGPLRRCRRGSPHTLRLGRAALV